MNSIDIPIVVGPGSQPVDDDGLQLDYLPMPTAMSSYATPAIPEPEEVTGAEDAVAVLKGVQAALAGFAIGDPAVVLPLDGLDEPSIELVNQVLGNGEVSIRYHADTTARVQESVLAGVWRVQYMGADGQVERALIEIAPVPRLVTEATFGTASASLDCDHRDIPDDVCNAAPLLTEINDKLPGHRAGSAPHVINLSLLPHTSRDIEFLCDKLGAGPVTILSRGYGNCRITSTATPNVWWVQYYNSQETLILNTIEISGVPDVACAAQEDIDDSAERLRQILELYT